jgi:hypothetical protein
VDGPIATNPANFVGTFDTLAELQAVQNPTKNDYGFVIESDAQGNEYYDRYKYTGTQWLFEYKVESTPFTTEQWAAIQSGITAALVTKLSALPTNAELNTALAGKQPVINDLTTIRSGAAAGATAYQKPSSGIPKTDLASAVQTSLGKADAAAPQSTTYTKAEVDAALALKQTSSQLATINGSRIDHGGNVTIVAAEGQTITIDATPTAGSNNAVSSGGAANALADKPNTTDLLDTNDLITSTQALTSGGFYDYKANLAWASNNACAGARIDVQEGQAFRFTGAVAYSHLAAVIFADADNNILRYMYGDNTSTPVSFDTGIVWIPRGCTQVYFNAYTASVVPSLTLYETPKVVTKEGLSADVNNQIFGDDKSPVGYFGLTLGGYYKFDTGVWTTGSAFGGCELLASRGDFVVGQYVSFYGVVRYSLLAAVQFWNNDTQIAYYNKGDGTTTAIDTGLIKIPEGCTRILFDAYVGEGVGADIFVYDYPTAINSINIDKWDDKTNYIAAYRYLFGSTEISDVTNSGFDSNYSSSTAGAFLIHTPYFKGYRRCMEWRVLLGNNAIINVGTNNQASSVAITDRQTKITIDTENGTMANYGSGSSAIWTESFGSIDSSQIYIIRLTQHDLIQRVELINENTLEVVASHTDYAHWCRTVVGKLLGRPFIQLTSGTLTVKSYTHYLMNNPEIVFIGDSITECGYRCKSYAAMAIEKDFNDNGCIVAQGGATDDSLAISKESELRFMKPKYLSILSGTNGGITAAQIENWKTFCESNGIVYLRHFVPVSKVPSTYPWATKNEVISNSGVLGAHFDFATALNNNPNNGANTSLFGDDVHPNADGQVAMYKRFKNDIRIKLWKE